MSVIIRLQNLPWSANALDIRRFFQGLTVPDGGVHIVGGENGDAFIAFSSDEDARQAMLRNNGKINDNSVTLMLSSKTEMQNVIAVARGQMPAKPPVASSSGPANTQAPPLSSQGFGTSRDPPAIDAPRSMPPLDFNNLNRPSYSQDGPTLEHPLGPNFRPPELKLPDHEPHRSMAPQQPLYQQPPMNHQGIPRQQFNGNQAHVYNQPPRQEFNQGPRPDFNNQGPPRQDFNQIPPRQDFIQGPRPEFNQPRLDFNNQPRPEFHNQGPRPDFNQVRPQMAPGIPMQGPPRFDPPFEPPRDNFRPPGGPDFEPRHQLPPAFRGDPQGPPVQQGPLLATPIMQGGPPMRQPPIQSNLPPPGVVEPDRLPPPGNFPPANSFPPYRDGPDMDRRFNNDRRFSQDRDREGFPPQGPPLLPDDHDDRREKGPPPHGMHVEIIGMPKTVKYSDVRSFFQGCRISQDGLKLINTAVGLRTGRGFIKFYSEEDCEKALRRNHQFMEECMVSVRPCAPEDFENAIDSYTPGARSRGELRYQTPPPRRIRNRSRSRSPRRRSRSPHGHRRSPHKRGRSPGMRSRSPKRRGRSPERRRSPARGRSPTRGQDQRMGSNDQRSTSKRSRSPLGDKREVNIVRKISSSPPRKLPDIVRRSSPSRHQRRSPPRGKSPPREVRQIRHGPSSNGPQSEMRPPNERHGSRSNDRRELQDERSRVKDDKRAESNERRGRSNETRGPSNERMPLIERKVQFPNKEKGSSPHVTQESSPQRHGIPLQDDRRGLPQNDRRGHPQDDRRGPSQDDRRGHPQDDRRGPLQDDRRGPSQDDRRGPPQDDRRGPSQDDRRGPLQDDRRGPSQDDRQGPPQDDRNGPLQDDRLGLPQDEIRGPGRNWRGPTQVDRRGPSPIDRHSPHRRRSPPPRHQNDLSVKLSNLPEKIERSEVKEFFKNLSIDPRIGCYVEFDKDGRVVDDGCAYVVFTNYDDFKKALSMSERVPMQGKYISIHPISNADRQAAVNKHKTRHSTRYYPTRRSPPRTRYINNNEDRDRRSRDDQPRSRDDRDRIRDDANIEDPPRRVEISRQDDDPDGPSRRSGSSSPHYILRMHGVPYNASIQDIREFFNGCEIVPGGIHIIIAKDGKATGVGFVDFATEEDEKRALLLHGNLFLNTRRYIELSGTTKDQMLQELRGADRNPKMSKTRGGGFNSPTFNKPSSIDNIKAAGLEGISKPGCIIGIQNLPYTATIPDILALFSKKKATEALSCLRSGGWSPTIQYNNCWNLQISTCSHTI
ncbi:unnamed protein product [Owenia fusiformis]|uniref:Uncharacterized protein n=1 Tax=Owenia fusiformis TaxID=6347 RepID=A0A8J1UTZ8_OWEFU|nr:unnamed protein product [Owenia fusiformis]